MHPNKISPSHCREIGTASLATRIITFLSRFTFPTPSTSRSHPPSATPFSADSGLARGDGKVGRDIRENTSHMYMYMYHTDIVRGQDFVLRNATREREGKYRAAQVRRSYFSFNFFSFPGRSLKGSWMRASRPRRRRDDGDGDAHEFGHGERERFSRFTTARGPPRPPRIPLFAGHTGPMRDVDQQTTDTPDSKVAAVLRASAARTRALAEPRLARIRTYAPPHPVLSLDFKLALFPILPRARTHSLGQTKLVIRSRIIRTELPRVMYNRGKKWNKDRFNAT